MWRSCANDTPNSHNNAAANERRHVLFPAAFGDDMEERLTEILIEVRNLSFLFFAYGVIWALLFLYLWTISRRNRDLRKEVDEMKKLHPPEETEEEQE